MEGGVETQRCVPSQTAESQMGHFDEHGGVLRGRLCGSWRNVIIARRGAQDDRARRSPAVKNHADLIQFNNFGHPSEELIPPFCDDYWQSKNVSSYIVPRSSG